MLATEGACGHECSRPRWRGFGVWEQSTLEKSGTHLEPGALSLSALVRLGKHSGRKAVVKLMTWPLTATVDAEELSQLLMLKHDVPALLPNLAGRALECQMSSTPIKYGLPVPYVNGVRRRSSAEFIPPRPDRPFLHDGLGDASWSRGLPSHLAFPGSPDSKDRAGLRCPSSVHARACRLSRSRPCLPDPLTRRHQVSTLERLSRKPTDH